VAYEQDISIIRLLKMEAIMKPREEVNGYPE